MNLATVLHSGQGCSPKMCKNTLIGPSSSIAMDLYDIHLGFLTGECSSTEDPACSCNQAGRAVWLCNSIDNTPQPLNYVFTTSDSKCFFENEDIPVPVTATFVSYTSRDLTAYATTADYTLKLLNAFGTVPRTATRAATDFHVYSFSIDPSEEVSSYPSAVYFQ